MKTYLFTHTDLDGVGCAVLATTAYGPQPEDLEVNYVNYHNVNDALMQFIADTAAEENFRLLITDIAPEGADAEKVAEAINVLHESKRAKVFLCDHHTTTQWIKKYSWAWQDVSKSMCGTKLLLEYLQQAGHVFSPQAIEFAECVCVYDNWLTDHPLRPRSEGMNRYVHFVGFARFVYEFSHDLAADLSVNANIVIEQLKRNEKAYVKKVVEQQCVGDFILTDPDGNKYCILVCERNVSQVCHGALEAFSELDYAMNLNPAYDKGDLRSRDGGVDVYKIAKKLGGGGRQATAGFQMSFQDVLKLALKDAL